MDAIAEFLACRRIGVAGASKDPEKYGHKVLVDLLAHGYEAIPINPRETAIEGQTCVATVDQLPDGVEALSIITPPKVTEQIVESAARRGIRRLWMQPGAESEAAIRRAGELGLTLIAGGPCVLVALRTRPRG